MIDTKFSYINYLTAKKSVDDKALNKTVFYELKEKLSAQYAENTLLITEFGSGIGTMIERLIDWGLFNNCVYTCIEKNSDFIMQTAARLHDYADANEFQVSAENGQSDWKYLRLKKKGTDIRIHLITENLFHIHPDRYEIPPQDLIIAHTFLDIFHLPTVLNHMFSFLRNDGLFYFTSNYDGVTHFLPHTLPEIDERMEELYNKTMDMRASEVKQQGGSRCGRKLFSEIVRAGGQILESGSSDWVIFPGESGYSPDEKYFVECLVKTALSAITELSDVAGQDVEFWASRKLEQLNSNELIFQAHQLDFLGKKL
ncbi:MAG: hypothetical protein GF372_04460 [Candidatus Marinimicrobia bacterium]|nr:hypothetical protein [Candidatus Neomarinimicrobiota bacterium]